MALDLLLKKIGVKLNVHATPFYLLQIMCLQNKELNHKLSKDNDVINSNITKQYLSINKTKILDTIEKSIDKGKILQEY